MIVLGKVDSPFHIASKIPDPLVEDAPEAGALLPSCPVKAWVKAWPGPVTFAPTGLGTYVPSTPWAPDSEPLRAGARVPSCSRLPGDAWPPLEEVEAAGSKSRTVGVRMFPDRLPESSVDELTTWLPGTSWYAWHGTLRRGDRSLFELCPAPRGVLPPVLEELREDEEKDAMA